MATLIVPNTFLVSLNGESGGQDVVNVIGITGGFLSASLVAEGVAAAYAAAGSIVSQASNLHILTSVEAVDLSFANGDVYHHATNIPGLKTGQLATNGSCALVQTGGGTRARSSRGRVYFGPLTEGDIQSDGRTLDGTRQIAIHNAWNKFHAELASRDLSWCVVSRKFQTRTIIQMNSVRVQPIIATQRRRIRS